MKRPARRSFQAGMSVTSWTTSSTRSEVDRNSFQAGKSAAGRTSFRAGRSVC